MKYYEVLFTLNPCTQDMRDVLSAMAGDAGFETFEEVPTGLKGYVQQALLDREALDAIIGMFPFADAHIHYEVSEAEDRDWNEQWEQEGFNPIVVDQQLIIHDGRHLGGIPDDGQYMLIEIDAHLAFGTGTHDTTRMICSELLKRPMKGLKILDCGCGTGILGICALKLGASECVAYDIDEWSAANTRHNAVINQVDDRLTVYCSDATLLDTLPTSFNVVMANINRNILLADMNRFHQVMADGAILILSGFYENDCALLTDKAQSMGLSLVSERVSDHWACLVFQR